MHEDAVKLEAKKRERVGSRYCRRIREQGGLPAVVYGHGLEPVAVTLEAKEALTHIQKGEKVFQMDLEGGQGAEYVLLKDLQFDHLGTNIVHADFARIDLNERVEVRVPIHLVGEAKGLKKAGAVLMHPASQIELECAVSNLPDYIEVDVSGLDVGDAIHAGDVRLPKETMVLLSDAEMVLAQIVLKAEEEASDEEAAVTAEGAGQPEVLSEKKREEEDKG